VLVFRDQAVTKTCALTPYRQNWSVGPCARSAFRST